MVKNTFILGSYRKFLEEFDSKVQNLIRTVYGQEITFFVIAHLSAQTKKKCAGSVLFYLGLNFLYYNLLASTEKKSMGYFLYVCKISREIRNVVQIFIWSCDLQLAGNSKIF